MTPKDTRRKDQLEEHAHHEAGHYAALLVLPELYPGDFPVKAIHQITLVQKGDRGGGVLFDLDSGWDNIPLVVQLLAGSAAYGVWTYLSNLGDLEQGIVDLEAALEDVMASAVPAMDGGGIDDRGHVEKHLGQHANWEPYMLEAVRLVHQNWHAVRRVALLLLEKRTLTDGEARAAFYGHPS